MSDSARFHAREWAKGKTFGEIAAQVVYLRSIPRNTGVEFDDTRVNHMTQTEISTLESILFSHTFTS